jgi:hypothetical protein
MTPKYETINGTLCRMVEPTPLTETATFPCAVRLIQDDSRMGMYNRDTKPSRLSDIYLVARIVGNSIIVDEFMESDYHRFEIIGYPVETGSAEWAWQMLMLGIPVSHPAEGEFQDTHYTKEGFVSCMAKTGWQLYEPKQEPAFKVGDWVEIEVAGVISQQRVRPGVCADSINAGGIEFYSNGLPLMKFLSSRITRKLDPSEVKVKVTLEGTVRLNGEDCEHFLLKHSPGRASTIRFDALDPATAKMVRELVAMQEEK